MADKLGLGNGERQLKLGQSFTNPKSSAFHTVRYDFKPASVDINKMASVEVGSNNQVTVTVPHLDGAGVPQTVFKGSQRPYHKECVLIIDRVTGVITLEKLSSNIQVKKTRSEAIKPPMPQVSSSSDRNTTPNSDRLSAGGLGGANRPQTPPIGQRTSNKTRVTSGSRRPDRQITHLVPKHSPLHASPSYSSPGHYKSPKRDHIVNNNTNNDTHAQSTLASLPMIGMDDVADPPVSVAAAHSSSIGMMTPPSTKRSPPVPPVQIQQNGRDLIGEISDTSSSSSDSDSASDHETTTASKGVKGGNNRGGSGGGGSSSGANAASRKNGHHANGFAFGSNSSPSLSMPAHILSEDLCLSESGSDSD